MPSAAFTVSKAADNSAVVVAAFICSISCVAIRLGTKSCALLASSF